MGSQNKCKCCGDLFYSKSGRSYICSIRCYNNRKIIDTKIGEVAKCPRCGDKFLKKSGRSTCSRTCSLKIINKSPINVPLYIEAKLYHGDLIKKAYYLDEVDIFKLIHIYDKIWPERVIYDGIRKDLLYEQLITEIILWTKSQEKKIKLNENSNKKTS